MTRNLLLCLDGTRNEPETGATNVVRLFDLAVKDDGQLCYYDPGVGTMGARSATTRLGQFATRVGGLVVGHGIRQNIEDAYGWLMRTYQPGDRVFVVGFSRGAYTSLALTGMLSTVGLLRPGADNLLPYALKLYAQNSDRDMAQADREKFWRTRQEFTDNFGNPAFPSRFAPQVAFLGVWDTVKSVGWLNAKARFEQAHWPFTRKPRNVEVGRLALALDERRGPYAAYRFDPEFVRERAGALQEQWFVGVHSDVGGRFADHRLSDIALGWMTDEAEAAGLRLDPKRYAEHVGVPPGTPVPAENAIEGKIHHNGRAWWLAGPGWRPRTVLPGDSLHPSVLQRVEGTASSRSPYRPELGRRG